MDWIADPQAWIAFATLLGLEIVLGVDNVIFISILASKLPAGQQGKARFWGLGLAMFTRILLLLSIAWVIRLTAPLFELLGRAISGRDIILIVGGLFLIGKATHEIHEKLEGEVGDREHRGHERERRVAAWVPRLGSGDDRRLESPVGEDEQQHGAGPVRLRDQLGNEDLSPDVERAQQDHGDERDQLRDGERVHGPRRLTHTPDVHRRRDPHARRHRERPAGGRAGPRHDRTEVGHEDVDDGGCGQDARPEVQPSDLECSGRPERLACVEVRTA